MTYYPHTQYQLPTQFRETGIHAIKIQGAAAMVSDQCGSLIIFGKPEYVNIKVTLRGRTSGQETYASFKPWRINGQPGSVAEFSRRLPENCVITSAIYQHLYQDVTIQSNWVVPVYWTN